MMDSFPNIDVFEQQLSAPLIGEPSIGQPPYIIFWIGVSTSSLPMYKHHCTTLGFLVLLSEHPWWPITDALLYLNCIWAPSFHLGISQNFIWVPSFHLGTQILFEYPVLFGTQFSFGYQIFIWVPTFYLEPQFY